MADRVEHGTDADPLKRFGLSRQRECMQPLSSPHPNPPVRRPRTVPGYPSVMYAQFFGLHRAPFSIAPDPRTLFMSERHREALAHLMYGVAGGGGVVLLSGEVGAGKTTICRCFLEQAPAGCQVAYIFNPKLNVTELLQTICEEFGVALPAQANPPPPGVPMGVKASIDALNVHLLAVHAQGRQCVLIIDEAQSLSPEVLEQLRLLTNLETDTRKLLQIILIGQPELREMLAAPDLAALAQRVIARCHLGPLSESETTAYLAYRLAVAGLTAALPFDGPALRAIHRHTGGIPRRINLLADRALLGAYAEGRRNVGRRMVIQAALEVFGAGPAAGRGRQVKWLGLAGIAVALLASVAFWASPGWRAGGGGLVGRTVASPALGAGLGELGASSAAAAAAPGGGGAAMALALPAASDASRTLAVSASSPTPAGAQAASATRAPAAAALAPAPASLQALTGVALLQALAQLPRTDQTGWRELASLWGLNTADLAGRDPCQAVRAKRLRCYRSDDSTLAQLTQFDRPALLVLHLPDGLSRVARLMALDGQRALLAQGDLVLAVPVTDLTRWWRGEYMTLWRAPVGYVDVLQAGARGAVVDALAQDLAALNQDRPPAAGQVLTGALAARLAGFQMSQNLRPDGVAGPSTFMQLNRAAGMVEPHLRNLPVER